MTTSLLLQCGLVWSCAVLGADQEPPVIAPGTVLATLGDESITEADFQLFCAVNNLPRDKQPPLRARLISQLVERQLIRRFLKRQKITADTEELKGHLLRMEDLIRRRKDDPDELLQRLGLTKAALEAELGLSLAWEAWIRKTILEPQIAGYYEQHRAELDNTKLRASQIILKLGPDARETEITERRTKLAAVRKEIVTKKLSFSDAAKKYSEAPSKLQGGDVGWFPFRGKMPIPFCDAAFALQVGEISEPVVTPFGVHLIHVTDLQPGDLTLEDVRNDIISLLAQDLWSKTAAAEREKTTVVIKPEKSGKGKAGKE